jgi:hypothetical protein
VGSRGIGEGSTCKHHATSRHAPFDADPGDESPARGLDAPSVGVAGGDDAGEEPSGVSLSAGCSSNNINSGASANKHRGRWRMQRSTHNTAQHTAAVPHNTPQAYTLHTAHCTLHTAHCTQPSNKAHRRTFRLHFIMGFVAHTDLSRICAEPCIGTRPPSSAARQRWMASTHSALRGPSNR